METDKWIELAMYAVPAVVTGGIAYLMMQKFVNLDENRRKFQLLRDNQKQALPIRLQAYERMALFLERINPIKLMIRVAPLSDHTTDYMNLLIQNIEQESQGRQSVRCSTKTKSNTPSTYELHCRYCRAPLSPPSSTNTKEVRTQEIR